MKKNNAWNIRRLVDEVIVPWTHGPIDPAYHIEDCWIFCLRLSVIRGHQPQRIPCRLFVQVKFAHHPLPIGIRIVTFQDGDS